MEPLVAVAASGSIDPPAQHLRSGIPDTIVVGGN